jgi:hypothetical protein
MNLQQTGRIIRRQRSTHLLADVDRVAENFRPAIAAGAARQGAAEPAPRRSRTAATASCWLSREPAAYT